MTPQSLHNFFIACAGVAGTLIGLLFVAISVEHDRLTAEDASQLARVRASAALTAFTNAFVVSLFALIPDIGLRWTTFGVSAGGLLFIAASLLSLLRVRRLQPIAPRETVFLAGLLVVFALQLYYALRLIARASDAGAAEGIAVLVVVCFLIGVSRAWELIGGPAIGIGSEVTAIVRGRTGDHDTGSERVRRPGDRDEAS